MIYTAYETLYSGQFTLSIQVIKLGYLVIPSIDAVPQLHSLEIYPLYSYVQSLSVGSITAG